MLTTTQGYEVSLMRGATGNGVLMRLDDLPPAGPQRDELMLGMLGSPDPMQLDGLGGSRSSTSKVMSVSTADTARRLGYDVPNDADIVSLVATITMDSSRVEWRTNCGNLTSAAPVYALHEGLVQGTDPLATVRLFNLNTRTPITLTVPVEGGIPRETGDYTLAGVPGTGARIDVTFHVARAMGERPPMFPTGHRRQELPDGDGRIDATIIHVNNPFVVVRAESLGIVGSELPDELNADSDLVARLERIRGAAAVELGLAPSAAEAVTVTPAIPRVVILSSPHDHRTVAGTISAQQCDVVARMTSLGPVHHALTGTGLVVTSVVALVAGTVADGIVDCVGPDVRMAHPKGLVTNAVAIADNGTQPTLTSVTMPRTARRLFRGMAYPSPAAIGILPRE